MPYALLIDDDVSFSRSLVAHVETRGLELLAAPTWEEGLELFLTLSPDLVIADYNLPGTESGLELLLKIKRLRPGTRVILISGYLEEDEVAAVADSTLVERAVRKSPAEMATIADEIASAAANATEQTDWVAVAGGYESGALDEAEVQRLLAVLRRPSGG